MIARNSSFTYKGQKIDVKQIGSELGARYVLEGSARKAGNRLRITAQLIDAESGAHVWAERFDRELEDIFDLQDEITERIVHNIMPEISLAEAERAIRVPSANLDAWEYLQRDAWEYLQRGAWHLYRYTREDTERRRANTLSMHWRATRRSRSPRRTGRHVLFGTCCTAGPIPPTAWPKRWNFAARRSPLIPKTPPPIPSRARSWPHPAMPRAGLKRASARSS